MACPTCEGLGAYAGIMRPHSSAEVAQTYTLSIKEPHCRRFRRTEQKSNPEHLFQPDAILVGECAICAIRPLHPLYRTLEIPARATTGWQRGGLAKRLRMHPAFCCPKLPILPSYEITVHHLSALQIIQTPERIFIPLSGRGFAKNILEFDSISCLHCRLVGSAFKGGASAGLLQGGTPGSAVVRDGRKIVCWLILLPTAETPSCGITDVQ
ncbi:hypothetical protein V8C26DRAFT_385478 [Trichoderma gracile]